jgi:DNA repair photolyase
VTKSYLVLRDLDVLASMASRGLANVFVSVTTLDPALARVMEPRAAAPDKRIETVRRLSEAGVPVGVLASPMIPALNDAELERILEEASRAGAKSASYILLRLPLELKDLFAEWLEAHYPKKASHVMSLIRDSRDGALYRPQFGERMRGTGPYADMLEQRFRVAARKLGLDRRLPPLDTTRFARQARRGDQLDLFAGTSG